MNAVTTPYLNTLMPNAAPSRMPSHSHFAAAFGTAEHRTAQLRDSATKLVATALVQPALASMHESPLRPRTGPFAPGTAEKRFSPMLDEQFADRIAKAGNFNLIDRVVKQFTQNHNVGVESGLDHLA